MKSIFLSGCALTSISLALFAVSPVLAQEMNLTADLEEARAKGDVHRLLDLTKSFQGAGDDASAGLAFRSAVDAAEHEACFDPGVTNSGTKHTDGIKDLESIHSFFQSHFGEPNPGASGLLGDVSRAEQDAESKRAAVGTTCLPAPNLNGNWCFRGIAGKTARIQQYPNNNLFLVTEGGVQENGHLADATHFVIDDGPFAGLKGIVVNQQGQPDPMGNRINWSNPGGPGNGENWQRCSQ